MPGTARIGPIEMTGFDGPTTMASASASAARHLGRGTGALDAAQLDPLDRPLARGRRS